MPGDPELENADLEDRFIKRGRGHVRVFKDSLPRNKERQLDRTGKISLTLGQAISVYRRVFWNRSTGAAEDTGIGACV